MSPARLFGRGSGDSVFGSEQPALSVDVLAAEGDAYQPAALAACDCGECEACLSDAWPQWYAQAETIFLWRDNNARVKPVAQSFNNITLLDTRSTKFDVGVGPQIVVGFRTSPNSGWEGEYFSALDMKGDAMARDTFFVGADVLAEYTSELHNAEINYVYTWDKLSLLAGFRFVRLSENYRIRWDAMAFGHQSHTDNDLYGGQIGARWKQGYRRVFWEATGKAGIFGNDANQSQSMINGALQETSPAPKAYGSTVAFVGDVNVSLGFRISQVWSLRGGYNVMWIDRVALAPDAPFSNGLNHPIATDGSVFLHGANVGLEGRW